MEVPNLIFLDEKINQITDEMMKAWFGIVTRISKQLIKSCSRPSKRSRISFRSYNRNSFI